MNFEEIYDNSYERILNQMRNGKTFFDAFYHNFLGASEEVREKFIDTDMERQKSILKKSFYHLLVFYSTNHADDYIEKIATAHDQHHLDIRPELYDLWLEILMLTLKTYDDEYDDNVELAWRLVFTPGITYMKFKYSRAISE